MTQSSINITWPPPYRLRRSRRARRVSLYFHPRKGLELVLPMRMSERQGILFLESQRAWVEKNYQLVTPWVPSFQRPDFVYPSQLCLPAIAQTYTLRYHRLPGMKRVTLSLRAQELSLIGNIDDFHLCLRAIKTWLKQQAQLHLPAWVEQISSMHRLCYDAITFRGQKTIWGSCSRTREISLNYKLLLLPQKLVQYVIIHELCHTQFFNHSKRFWALVGKYEPDYKNLKKELRHADQYLPEWLHEK